jgi:hypothetical protein
MLGTIIRKASLPFQRILYSLVHRSIKPHHNRLLADEIKVQLEWCMREVMNKYPYLTFAQAEEVLEMFYRVRHLLIQEGWCIIDRFVKAVLRK